MVLLMNNEITIRETESGDAPSLETLYQEAFEEEVLFPLVTELLDDAQNTLHLTAVMDDKPIGHIAFTKCHASPEHVPLYLLGPMAVFPNCQKQGIGSKLIAAGFERLRNEGVAKVIVFGDPNFYGKSGFIIESSIEPAYPIPEDYIPGWQSISFLEDAPKVSGKLQITKPWHKPELWSN